MSKAKVTRKWVKDNYWCCSVGYCNLQNLLHYVSADFYTCGVYGWNFDVYTFGDYAITTGYRGMIDNIPTDYHSLIHEYDDKARVILEDMWNKPAEELKKEINDLLNEFLQKVFNTSFDFHVFLY